MDISCRGRYATRAMLELAQGEQGQPIPLSLIAERQDISRKYLQQLMGSLRRAGLVRVVKGFRGGFMLSKSADKIRIGDILRALEGDLALVECVRFEDTCPRNEQCTTRGLWAKASEVIEGYFDSVTLADVNAGEY